MRLTRFTSTAYCRAVTSFSIALMVGGGFAQAQDDAAGDSGASLRAATQNPISSMYSLPFKFSFDNGADNGDANTLSIQPVLPVTVGDWNLVNRIIIPLADAPGGVPGLPGNPGIGDTTESGRTSGLGDINSDHPRAARLQIRFAARMGERAPRGSGIRRGEVSGAGPSVEAVGLC